jgi:hypothetical protein
MPESEDEFLCVVGKGLRKSSVKDQAFEGSHYRSSLYLKYEVVFKGYSNALTDFQFTHDAQTLLVMSITDIVALDPFTWQEKIRYSRLPAPQPPFLMIPPRFDAHSFPFLVLDNLDGTLLVTDIAALPGSQVETIDSGTKGFRPLGIVGVDNDEQGDKSIKIMGIAKDGHLRLLTLDLY